MKHREDFVADSKLFLFIEPMIKVKELKDLVEMGWLFVTDVAIDVNWCNDFYYNFTQIKRN